MKITPVSGILGEVQVYKDLRQGRHLRFRENEWANLARTEKMTDPETGEPLEDEEIIEDTPLLINLKVSFYLLKRLKRNHWIYIVYVYADHF